jgi:hypothetical protein
MKFTTATNSATRTSLPVTIMSVTFNKLSRSILVVGSDNNSRACRIDRCETIELARSLFSKAKDLIGSKAVFHAAGGNDPSRWFFAIDEVVEDPADIERELMADGMPWARKQDYNPSDIKQVDKWNVELSGQAQADYIAARFPKVAEEEFDPTHTSPDWEVCDEPIEEPTRAERIESIAAIWAKRDRLIAERDRLIAERDELALKLRRRIGSSLLRGDVLTADQMAALKVAND